MEGKAFGVFLTLVGLFSLVASIQNWSWFMNHRKAQFMVSVLGNTGARIFYGILGAVLAVVGCAALLGFLHLK
jgi:purine-cytosine permease-like protein